MRLYWDDNPARLGLNVYAPEGCIARRFDCLNGAERLCAAGSRGRDLPLTEFARQIPAVRVTENRNVRAGHVPEPCPRA